MTDDDSGVLPECSICYSYFDHLNRKPCNGTCGHTICQECKENLKTSKCPLCQKDEAFASFVVNYELMKVIDSITRSSISNLGAKKKSDSCSNCEAECKKLYICTFCEKSLLSEDKMSALITTNAEDWIIETRKKAICGDCVIGTHHSHSIVLLNEFLKKFGEVEFHTKTVQQKEELNKLHQETSKKIENSLARIQMAQEATINATLQITDTEEIYKSYKMIETMTSSIRDAYTFALELCARMDRLSKCLVDQSEEIKKTKKITIPKGRLEVMGSDEPYLMADRKQNLKQALAIGKFHPKTRTFVVVGKISNQRSNYASVTVEDKVYLIGGMVGGNWLNTVEMYDQSCNRKIELAKMIQARTRTCAAYHKSRIFVCGGYDGVYLSSTEVYDMDKKVWVEYPSLQKRRADAAVISYNGELIVLGGFNGKDYEETIERFNESTNEFEVIGEMNGSRAGFGACVFRDRIYIAGGWNNSSNTLKTVKSYDLASKTWREERSMLKLRKYVTLHASCENVFAVRGCADNWSLIPDIEMLDLENQEWILYENPNSLPPQAETRKAHS